MEIFLLLLLFVFGGYPNCTLDLIIDRNGEEPHQMSATVLVLQVW